ncbi:sulfite exporter TauE/SafE family protein [Candidatus Peregrinibacteria bacterium]|nr:sulfite exporter TauE/SafE family protein [Candidatus Peregrinibacteria bacterium]
MSRRKKARLKILGMTCGSCEIILERALMKVTGVISADFDHRTGEAIIIADSAALPYDRQIQEAVERAGYKLFEGNGMKAVSPMACPVITDEKASRKWLEIGAFLLIIFGIFKIFQTLDLASTFGNMAQAATLGGIFVIGLVAGTSSCLAVTGGLLLSVAAKYNERFSAESRWQKFKPLLYFNIGRLASYFFFGGAVGVLGRSITLTPRITGYMNITVAVIMFSLAFSMLKIIPQGRFALRPPKRLSRWIAGLSESRRPGAPFFLGALTFFLPCGFTQSLQVVALASGSFFQGALTMFIFSLGTLPALIGISALSSAARGSFSRFFVRFSATAVLVLALVNFNSGLLLAGFEPSRLFASAKSALTDLDPFVSQNADGSQTIRMKVTSFGYEPGAFTVKKGIPTFIKADAASNLGGCTSVLMVPDFNIWKPLKTGQNTLGPFTPEKDFLITCSMAMVRAGVRVVP